MVRLKVCGITSLNDARVAIDCGATYLGFNFYAKSPRYISPSDAWQIISQLPPDIISVGVFVNEPFPEDVIRLMNGSGCQYAQLHGDETAEYCDRVGHERVIRALRVSPDFDVQSATAYPAAAVLLDAYDAKLYGGTGRTVNWQTAREVAESVQVFLAGGLSPDNIIEAVTTVRPFAVDVNSGVESAPGYKDADKLKQLRRALDSLSTI
jgi:phosphoribosylanthranilate isomerase